MYAQISQLVPKPLGKAKTLMPDMQIQDRTVVALKTVKILPSFYYLIFFYIFLKY